MGKVMLTVQNIGVDLTLDELMNELNLQPGEIDLEFGIQPLPPTPGDYVILVEESAARRIDPNYSGVSGTYSNPIIETFGPPEN